MMLFLDRNNFFRMRRDARGDGPIMMSLNILKICQCQVCIINVAASTAVAAAVLTVETSEPMYVTGPHAVSVVVVEVIKQLKSC